MFPRSSVGERPTKEQLPILAKREALTAETATSLHMRDVLVKVGKKIKLKLSMLTISKY